MAKWLIQTPQSYFIKKNLKTSSTKECIIKYVYFTKVGHMNERKSFNLKKISKYMSLINFRETRFVHRFPTFPGY